MPRKAKLPPVPDYSPPEKPARAKAKAAAEEVGPDLSHIAENLRPLAFPLADLAFMVGNAVKHPEKQLEELRASLRQFGQVEPLVVNRRETPPVVIGGNGRLQALLAEGRTHAAVCFVDMDKAKANALSLALNQTSAGREWDKEALDALLRNVNTGGDEKLDAMLSELAKMEGLVPAEEKEQEPAGEQQQEPNAVITCPECGHEWDGKITVTQQAS